MARECFRSSTLLARRAFFTLLLLLALPLPLLLLLLLLFTLLPLPLVMPVLLLLLLFTLVLLTLSSSPVDALSAAILDTSRTILSFTKVAPPPSWSRRDKDDLGTFEIERKKARES